MRLIVTEKNNSARRIAEILGDGAKSDKAYRVPYYTWSDGEGEHMVIGLKGHVLNPAFPDGYANWQETDPKELIDAELIKEPTDKNVLRALRKVAKDATSVVIATDFDREGELIGLEALEEILEVNPDAGGDVKRARFSALTRDEIERAFAELDDLAYDLAHAGAARQDIDLIWGATLTRAVSLATRRFGSNFLSVGRVQSPTLGLIVERELERRAHESKPYWEVLARFQHPDGAFEAHHTEDRFWERSEAEAAVAGTKSPGVVKEVSSRRSSRKPPAPFNTTSFTAEASSRLGITPSRAMQIAEDLYMDGFVSYPRTDNTVYPRSLPVRELIASLVRIREFEAGASLLDGELKPTRGKKESTDHPPIYPTQAVHPGALDGPHRRVYELVARRFLATFAPPMVTESTRGDIEAGSELYFVRGSVVVDPGYAAVYTYARSHDEEIPKLIEGQELELDGEPWILDKETQPPSRIGQGKLVEMMEERGLGTKATRPEIIQKLYDRGYVYGNPPQPTGTGIAMYEAFKRYVPPMASAEMTAELERDMDQIAAGETSKDEVLRISREMLHGTYDAVEEKREDLAKVIWEGADEDRILGPCKACEEAGRKQDDGSPNMLRVIRARKSGKRFVGCQGWKPDDPNACDQTFPLPQRGDIFKLEDRCSICGATPRVRVVPPRGRPWDLCLNEECPSMEEMRRRRAEREAARSKRGAAAGDGASGGDGAGAPAAGARRSADGASRSKRGPRSRRRSGSRARSD
jgi:DNA topoisomerase-1